MLCQEEERMAAERKIAAEQKLRALEDRCALREREIREKEEREAREREEREARQRAEREARDRAERESREQKDRERRERQQQNESVAAVALEQQQRSDPHRDTSFDRREDSRSPSSPRGDWGGSRRGAGALGGDTGVRSRPYMNGTSSDSFRRGEWEKGGEARSSWAGSRREGPGDYYPERKSTSGYGQQRDRTGDTGEARGPRKLFDPKQNR